MSVRNRMFLVVILGAIAMSNAQIVITINTAFHDQLSYASYKGIAKANLNMAKNVTVDLATVSQIEKVISGQNLELTSINPLLKLKELTVKNFIKTNSTSTDYVHMNSYGYIKKKYPIMNPAKGDNFRNIVIRERFRKRLEKERILVQNYFAINNYISEGERLYLVLSSLEKVINITIENEDY